MTLGYPALVVLALSFILVPMSQLSFVVNGPATTVVESPNGKLVSLGAGQEGWGTFFVPFLYSVKTFPIDQTTTATCEANLFDDTRIQADVNAELSLKTDQVVAMYTKYGSNDGLRQEMKSELCSIFLVVVSGYTASTMPPVLYLERLMAERWLLATLVGTLSVRSSGRFAITDLHAAGR